MSRRASRPGGRPWTTWAIVVVAVAAAAVALAAQWGRVREEAGDLSPLALLGAGGFAVAAVVASLLGWRAVLGDLGSPLGLRAAARLFLVAQLGKYVPGGVWPAVTHMELGREHAIPRHRALTAFAATSALSLLIGLLVAAATLPLAAGDRALEYAPLLVAVPVLAVLLHPRFLARLLDRGLARLGREPLERPPTWRGVLVAAAWLTAMWACFGAHTWLLARDLGGDGATLVALAAGAFAVSWIAGFLVFLTPAGVGVRDAALVGLLAGTLGAASATLLAVCSRLLLTLADVVLAATAALASRRARDA